MLTAMIQAVDSPTAHALRLMQLLSDRWQSAQQLSHSTGLSHDQLATLAKQLQAQGVPLHSANCGYRLEAGTPAASLVTASAQLGRPLYYLGKITSTQDTLRAWIKQSAQATLTAPTNANSICPTTPEAQPYPHGTLLVAENQSAGRGRQGRTWQSPKGMLAFSLLLRQPDPQKLPFWPLAVGVALRHACGVGQLKWPNDLVIDGRKLAGILLEAEMRGGQVAQVIVGVGLNVHEAPEGAAYLREFASVRRAEILSRFLAELEPLLNSPPHKVLEQWRQHALLGVETRVNTARGKVSGVAVAIDDQGGLVLRTTRGKITVQAGEVEMLGMRQVGENAASTGS